MRYRIVFTLYFNRPKSLNLFILIILNYRKNEKDCGFYTKRNAFLLFSLFLPKMNQKITFLLAKITRLS